MSVFFFIAAAGFFLAINFLFFAWDMIWYLGQGETSSLDVVTSEGTETVQRVLRFVFVQGAFFGLVLCYWRFPEPEPHFEAPSVDHSFIDRTGVIPREVEGSTPDTGIYEKKIGISEAEDSTPVSDKKVGVFEADGSKGILEADSNIVHETV